MSSYVKHTLFLLAILTLSSNLQAQSRPTVTGSTAQCNEDSAWKKTISSSGFIFTDADGDIIEGCIVVGKTDIGTWEYSIGEGWLAIPDVSATEGFYLLLNAEIRYTPPADFNGIISNALKLHAVQAGHGYTNATRVSNFSNSNSVSEEPASMTIEILSVNDAPVAKTYKADFWRGLGSSLADYEEPQTPTAKTVAQLFGSIFDDSRDNQAGSQGSNSNSLAGVLVAGNAATASQGKWQYTTDGTTWLDMPDFSSGNRLFVASNTELRFLPAPDFNGIAGQLTVHLADNSMEDLNNGNPSPPANGSVVANPIVGGTTRYSEGTVELTTMIRSVNDAPVVVSGKEEMYITRNDIEDTQSPTQKTIDNLFNPAFDDSRDNQTKFNGSSSNALAGVLVTGNAATPNQGSWQYYNGSSWNTIDACSEQNAFFIPSGGTHALRFFPAPNFNGTPGGLTVHLADNSNTDVKNGNPSVPSNYSFVSNPIVGGTTRYSEGTVRLLAEILPNNDAPVATADNVSFFANPADADEEDTQTPTAKAVADLFGSIFDDSHDDQTMSSANLFIGVVVTQTTAEEKGVWQYSTNGTTWTAIADVSISSAIYLSNSTLLRFLPATNFNGTADELCIRLVESGSGSVPLTGGRVSVSGHNSGGNTRYSADDVRLTIFVKPVNDAPTALEYQTPLDKWFIDEDISSDINSSLTGKTVEDLFSGRFEDVDATNVFVGIVVASLTDNGEGTWQYNSASGWESLQEGRYMGKDVRIRFLPNSSCTTTPVTLHAYLLEDQGDGSTSYTTNQQVGTNPTRGGTEQISQNSIELPVQVKPGIGRASIASITSVVYTGAAHTPKPEIKFNSATLAEEVDYTLSYSNHTNAGTATVIVTGKGSFSGTVQATFTISLAEVSGIEAISPLTYAGTAHEPMLVVKAGSLELPTTDYDVVWSNNTNAGTATVSVTGKGNFKGEASTTFEIEKATLTEIEPIPSQPYTAMAHEPVLVVKAGILELQATDYNLVWSNNTNAGTATFTVTGKGNFKGVANATFEIEEATLTEIEPIPSQPYTATEQEPALVVRAGSLEVPTTDYNVVWNNNTNAGTATVTITGKGNFKGEASTTFEIEKATLTEIEPIPSQPYTATEQEPALVVRAGSLELQATDYNVVWNNNTNAGTATVTITGKGNFKGEASATFEIEKATPSLIITGESCTYTGNRLSISSAIVSGVVGNSTVSVSYQYQKDGTATDYALAAGDYRVTATLTVDANHRQVVSNEVSFRVEKATPSIQVSPKITSYTGAAIAIDTPTFTGSTTAGSLAYTTTYTGTNGTIYPVSTQAPTNRGEYEVVVATMGDENHEAASQAAMLTISSAEPVVTFDGKTAIYNGEAHSIDPLSITVYGQAQNLNVTYTYEGDGYTASTLPPTDAGSYTVTASIPENAYFEARTVTANLLILKADQSISFDSSQLDGRTHTDMPFTLQATASSGLSVTFASLNPDIVDVDSNGLLTIKKAGTASISIQQEGNKNHNAITATHVITILSTSAELIANINGEQWDMTKVYTIGCSGNEQLHVKLSFDEYATISIPNSEFWVDMSSLLYKELPITVTPQLGSSVLYTLKVQKNFSFSDYIVQKWNNVLMFDLKKFESDYHIDSQIVSFKWYANNTLLHTDSKPYYSAGQNATDHLMANASYHVEIQTQNGATYRSCPETLVHDSFKLSAYPNPVRHGGEVKVEATMDDEQLKNAVIEIYDMHGRKLGAATKVTGKLTSVPTPNLPGVYILNFKGSDGFREPIKIIVE